MNQSFRHGRSVGNLIKDDIICSCLLAKKNRVGQAEYVSKGSSQATNESLFRSAYAGNWPRSISVPLPVFTVGFTYARAKSP